MKKLNDLLWDGELKIYQDDNKFMFSLDSILLAYFVNIKKCAKNILDIGTGNAPIPLMLSKRTSADITGVEIQESSYLLAKESVQYNKLEDQINIINGDIKELSLDMKNNYYDTIVSNPPYFKSNTMMSNNDNKKIARSEVYLSLEDILKISKRLLKDTGNVAIVNRPDRLCDIFILMKKFGIEPKRIQFVYPKKNRQANLILIEGTKNGNCSLKVMNPIIVHDDNNNYTEEIVDILKNFTK